MDLQLSGKLALVSGSTAGIGYAIAQALAREGVAVIVNGRQQASVDAAVQRIRAETQGTVHGYAGDLSRAASSSPSPSRTSPTKTGSVSSTSTCSAACAWRAWCCRR
jgi:NAD(P)-dependent dehydrogenase (short-subunit alcohol dehydrogenase family)